MKSPWDKDPGTVIIENDEVTEHFDLDKYLREERERQKKDGKTVKKEAKPKKAKPAEKKPEKATKKQVSPLLYRFSEHSLIWTIWKM